MNDILSQDEINKLLKSLITGEAEDTAQVKNNDPVKLYDFKTANRFTKEQIRAINIVFRNFGQLLSTFLMGSLRADCDAEVLSVEEMSFSEFNNSVPSPTIVAVVNSNPLPGSVIIEISKEVAYSVITRVLGGTRELASEERQFTEIELAIVERILWQILRILDEAWSKMMALKSSLEKIETSMQFAQVVDSNEAVLMVTLNITIGNESGIIGFCLPHQALEPFMKSLSANFVYTGKAASKAAPRPAGIIQSISGTEITVSCDFNVTEAAVRDILSLRVGDVIQLQHKVDEPLVLKYQQVPKYRAAIGKYGKYMAARILEEIRGDEEVE